MDDMELRPSSCRKCRDIFMANQAMQLEAVHVAHIEGLWGASDYIDTKLEDAHLEHS